MGITKPQVAKEFLRAITYVIVGATLIVGLKENLQQDPTPYYAMIAQQRVQSHVQINRQLGELTHDAYSGTSSK